MNFYEMHQQADPLLLANVWDAASAQSAEQRGYQVLGTSSAAMATMLGYPDGESISFAELKYLVKRIKENTTLPLSVDLESGYSDDPVEVARHISELAKMGVVGVNLEDSKVLKSRKLVPAEDFAQKLSHIKEQLKRDGTKVFLNIRTDTFLLSVSDPVESTIKRIHTYEQYGADGVFIPCIVQPEHIAAVVRSTALPVNVMCMPQLPSFDSLKELGVKRISMGNFLFDQMSRYFQDLLRQVKQDQNFQAIC